MMPPPPPPPAYPPPWQPYGLTCPFCRYQGAPLQKTQLSSNGWVMFIILLLFCLPLCWLPFVLSSFQETVRNCPACGAKLG